MSDAKFTKGPWEWREGALCRVDGGRIGFTYPDNAGNRALIKDAPDLYEALELAEKLLSQAWRTVDAICGADHGDPLPIESLPEDRQEMVYQLVEALADNGETIFTALRKVREGDSDET